MREGKGKYFYKTGDKYDGEWKDDKKSGEGVVIYFNGDIFRGNWEEDTIMG